MQVLILIMRYHVYNFFAFSQVIFYLLSYREFESSPNIGSSEATRHDDLKIRWPALIPEMMSLLIPKGLTLNEEKNTPQSITLEKEVCTKIKLSKSRAKCNHKNSEILNNL